MIGSDRRRVLFRLRYEPSHNGWRGRHRFFHRGGCCGLAPTEAAQAGTLNTKFGFASVSRILSTIVQGSLKGYFQRHLQGPFQGPFQRSFQGFPQRPFSKDPSKDPFKDPSQNHFKDQTYDTVSVHSRKIPKILSGAFQESV